MTFAAPWALLALFAVPAVVVLHLYRRRLPERRVAALFLFPGRQLAAAAGRQRTRLLRSPSLWLECLAAALAALWLAGPSFGGRAARHVVIVLDDSASMSARGTRERAAAAVLERADDLASDDRITLLRTGPRVEVLLGPRALPGEVAAAVPSWRPARPSHDPGPALDLARELAAGGGEVLFVTDGPPPPGADDATTIACGEAQPNAAILTAQRFPRQDGTEELVATVVGHGGATDVECVVRQGEIELARTALVLGERPERLQLALPPGTGAVHLQLGGDALAIDDEALLMPEPPRIVGVCDLLPAERRGQLQLARVLGALDGVRHEADPLAAQLVFAEAPGAPVADQVEVVLPLGDGERQAFGSPFAIERTHPWLAGVQLAGVVWLAEVRPLPGQTLVAAGNQALVTEEFLEQGRRLWIGVDASAGNLVRAPDWPVLLSNLVEQCRARVPGLEQVAVQVGGEARFRRSMLAGADDAEVVLETPDGRLLPVRAGRTVGWPIDAPGLHLVRGRSGAVLGRFAARFFDAAESDLRTRTTRTWAPTRASASAAASAVRETAFERRVLALLLALLVFADWWWLGRRGGAA